MVVGILLFFSAIGAQPLLSGADGRSFYYRNFADRSHLSIVGAAHRSGEILKLSGPVQHQKGEVWFEQPLNASEGLSTAFSFRPINSRPTVELRFCFEMREQKRDYPMLAVHFTFTTRSLELLVYIGDNQVARKFIEPQKSQQDSSFMELSVYSSFVEILLHGRFNTDLRLPGLDLDIDKLYFLGFKSSSEDANSAVGLSFWSCRTGRFDNGDTSGCFYGFCGPLCDLDLSETMKVCSSLTSCEQCTATMKDCRWCTSTQLCIASASPFNPASSIMCPINEALIETPGTCIIRKSLSPTWSTYVIAMLVIFILWSSGVKGKIEIVVQLRSIACGALLAVFVSGVVNSSLVAISSDPVCSLFYGTTLFILGGIRILRTLSENVDASTGYCIGSFVDSGIGFVFSCICTISAVLCFVLEKNWFVSFSAASKVPLYSVLAISLCYAFLLTTSDLILWTNSFVKKKESSPLSSFEQRLLSLTSVISGLYLGFEFGKMNLEDVSLAYASMALHILNSNFHPFAFLVGAFSGWMKYKNSQKNSFDSSPLFYRRPFGKLMTSMKQSEHF